MASQSSMRYIPASQPPAQPLKRNPQRNDNLIVRDSDQRLVVGVDLGTCDAKVAYAICDNKDNKLLELISRIETLDFEGAPALSVKVAYSPIKNRNEAKLTFGPAIANGKSPMMVPGGYHSCMAKSRNG